MGRRPLIARTDPLSGLTNMIEILRWLDMERVAIFLWCGPFFLFGMAWLAMRPRRGIKPRPWHRDFEEPPPMGGRPLSRRPLPMPKVLESIQ